MFRNEYKPPLTLWIEKNHYNTESKEEDNLQGLFTLNEDEDMAGIQFFDENNGNQVNYGSSGSGNTNFNAHQLEGDADKFAKSITDFPPAQAPAFIRSCNNLVRSCCLPAFIRRLSVPAAGWIQLQPHKNNKKEEEIYFSLHAPYTFHRITEGPSSNRPQSSSKYSRNGPDIDNLVNPNSNKYLQQFENDNLDYEKLGIIELEDDDFQDYYDI